MLSRVADSLYWMSRYLERAEHTARMLDLNLSLLDQETDATERRWRWVLASLRAAMPAKHGERSRVYAITEHLTFNPRNHDSLVACVTSARENARQVREQISTEMWEQLNQLYLSVRQARMQDIYAQPHEFYRPIKEGSHLFQGLTDATMTHGEGWHYLQLGRFIERASATASLLDVHLRGLVTEPESLPAETLAVSADHLSWVALLKCCTAFEAYVQVHTAELQPERIAEFLLLNAESPRSVRFAADRIERSLQALQRNAGRTRAGRAERLAGKLRSTLNYAQVDEIMADDLHAYLADIQHQGGQIHDAIQQQYITYAIDVALAS